MPAFLLSRGCLLVPTCCRLVLFFYPLTERENMNVTQEQMDLCLKHIELLIETNKRINLTRIEDSESAKLLHVEDSLVGLPYILEAPEGNYADLGTGGGFPGFPLAIATGRDTLLVDSVAKKVAELDKFAEALGLDNVSTYAGRIEELALERPGDFSVLTARALTAMPSLIELASPLLCEGGVLICYKSAATDDEVEAASKIQEKVAMYLIKDETIMLSDGVTPRRFLIYQKKGEPTVKLPRRPGMAQKRPYK